MELKKLSILNIVDNYSKKLFKYIRNSVRNDEDAEDILQDVWYQLISIIDIQPINNLSAWLFHVSRNRIIDKKRKLKTLSLEDFVYEDDEGEIIFPDDLIIDNFNPEIEFDNDIIRENILKAISELPINQRNVFYWNEIDEMTLKEIADKTGENIKTIISRKRYAVTQLRNKLENIYNDFY